jgi:hypothetical protein
MFFSGTLISSSAVDMAVNVFLGSKTLFTGALVFVEDSSIIIHT